MSIANVQLGITETTILAPSVETAILSVLFCNLDTSSRVITIYAYPTGGSASNGTTILKSLEILPLDTFIFSGDEKIILDNGGKISGVADVAAKITTTINYKAI